ncbi:MAG: aminoacyl-tRNA hydrolase, partial [Rhodanobacteraceae bacterium]|nr:aminoacyl-tRNA hydrolase [Rhodanobacteraceae bacterium]
MSPGNPIRVVFGLGNPGAEHARQRHNAGFWFADALADQLGVRLLPESKLNAEVGKGAGGVLLVKPTTYMNRSGIAVSAVLNYYKIDPSEALIVHDELDLPPGVARLKFDGGHGGQNGLRDTMAQLGHGKFHRLRIGIGHPGRKELVTPWVLGRPSVADEQAIRGAIDAALAV